jgi:uncharacterized LabA/DUF88 family protein
MAFIDGENVVARYQAMRAKGQYPKNDFLPHRVDEFAWCDSLALPVIFDPIRAYYYASVVGDDDKVRDLEDYIRARPAGLSQMHATSKPFLYPRVYKKPSKSNKTTTVDVQICVDVLTHTYQNDLDIVLLVTGDADYLSLARAVVSRGKRLLIAAFSDGLARELVPIADRFISLDEPFLGAPQ